MPDGYSIFPGGGAEFSRQPEDFTPKMEKYGLHRGFVEDVDDPEYRGRIRARVQGVHPNDPVNMPTFTLPWAENALGDGGGPDYGDFCVPFNIGDSVFILFINGRRDQPVYIGGWEGMREDRQYRHPDCPEEAWRVHDKNDQPQGSDQNPKIKGKNIYPRRRVIKTRHGHVIEVSDEPGDFEIILRTPIGQRIWLRESLKADGHKKFQKSIQIIDDQGNYIWMNTEDSLLDIFWQGNKNEHITGNVTQQIDGSRNVQIGSTETRASGGVMHDFGSVIDHN